MRPSSTLGQLDTGWHGLVANALDAGLTLPEASRLARDASPAVTATVYADVLEAKRDTLGARLAQAGFGA